MERQKQIIAAMFMAATLATECAAQAGQPLLLTDGTPVRLRLNRTISSADARTGETVDFEVLEDLQVNGMTVVPRGGTALATVTEAVPKRRMGRGGRLNVNIDHVRLASGEKVSLRAMRENSGGSHTGAMTGAIVATSIVFFPAAPLFLLMKGKDITVPKGTEITAYINGDTRLDAARFGAPAPVYASAGAVSPTYMRAAYTDVRPAGMSNEDVLELRAAGFSDDVIAAKIRSAQPAFRLDTTDLVQLKRAGVSQALIAAMIERSSRN